MLLRACRFTPMIDRSTQHLHRALFWTLIALAGATSAAEDPCAAFSWDVRHERSLFATAAAPVAAGKDAASAPSLAPERLYELTLAPQQQVTFAVAPGRKTPVDGSSAGLARLRLSTATDVRVSIDQGFWIDVVAGHELIAAKDFQGRKDCQAPHKIVAYSLPGGQDLILQLSGAIGSTVRLTITPVGAAPSPQ